MACPMARAASASPRRSKSSSAPGPRTAFSYAGKYYNFDNVRLTPKPYQKPVARYPHRRQQPRHLPGDRRSAACQSSSRCGSASCRNWSPISALIARLRRRPVIPARARCYLRAPVYVGRDRRRRRAPSPKTASCISIAISASGSRIRRRGRRAGDRGPGGARQAAAGPSPMTRRCATRSSSARPSRSSTG